MKIWAEKGWFESEEVKIGINWFKWSPEFSFKGLTIQFLILEHAFTVYWVDDKDEYNKYIEDQKRKKLKWKARLDRPSNNQKGKY